MSINLDILKNPRTINKEPRVVYRDLHLDIKSKYTNNDQFRKLEEITDIVSDINSDAIKNSIYNIFATVPGQKILNPEFGCNFMQWLFTNISENAALTIKQMIYKQIQKYEPRVTLQQVNVVPNYEQNEYTINIRYNNSESFDLTLSESGIYT